MDDEEVTVYGTPRHVAVGMDPPAEDWAVVRCAGCGKEATIPFDHLPVLPEGVNAKRDDDGAMLALCPRCVREGT